MNYELAKQLKDAEFPLVEVPLDPLVRGRWEVAHRIDGVDYFDPTLAELIAACGDGFTKLQNERPGFMAFGSDFSRNFGQVPEEAVAKLWLALNQKNV